MKSALARQISKHQLRKRPCAYRENRRATEGHLPRDSGKTFEVPKSYLAEWPNHFSFHHWSPDQSKPADQLHPIPLISDALDAKNTHIYKQEDYVQLFKMGILQVDTCLFYNEEAELLEHFLWECLAYERMKHQIFSADLLQSQRVVSHPLTDIL